MVGVILVDKRIGRVVEGGGDGAGKVAGDGEAAGCSQRQIQRHVGGDDAAGIGFGIRLQARLGKAQAEVVRRRDHGPHEDLGKHAGGPIIGNMDEVTQGEGAAGGLHRIFQWLAFHCCNQGLADPEACQRALARGRRNQDVEGIGRVGETQERGVESVRLTYHETTVDAEAELDAGIRRDDLVISGGDRGFHPLPLVVEGAACERHPGGDELLTRGRTVRGNRVDRECHHRSGAVHDAGRDHRATAPKG